LLVGVAVVMLLVWGTKVAVVVAGVFYLEQINRSIKASNTPSVLAVVDQVISMVSIPGLVFWERLLVVVRVAETL
jgi:hypothetical protein